MTSISAPSESPSEVDLAWAVGILEGEGCFTRQRRSRKAVRASPVVSCAMVDQDVITRLAHLFGGSLNHVREKVPGRQPLWQWTLTGVRAHHLMQMLLPYMGVRRSSRITELLAEFEDRYPNHSLTN